MKPYYQHAGITIYHGDCREIVPALGHFDLLLTDPPYGIDADNRKRNLSRTNLCSSTDFGESSWDKSPADSNLISLVRSLAKHQIIWGGNFFETMPASSGWLVWDKDNTGDFADCELAWTNLDMAVRKFQFRWNGMLQQNMRDKEPRFHPTQKPVTLMRWCLGFVKDCKSVIDPFLGSGSSLIACKEMGIKGTGIDREERYCEIAANRLAQEILIPC